LPWPGRRTVKLRGRSAKAKDVIRSAFAKAAMGCVKEAECVFSQLIHLFPPSLRGGERRSLGQRPK